MDKQVGEIINLEFANQLKKMFPDELFVTKRIGEFILISHTLDVSKLSALDNIELITLYRNHKDVVKHITMIYDEELIKQKEKDKNGN